MDATILAELRRIAGTEHVSDSRAALATHAFDATQRRFLPDAVVWSGSTEEVAAIVRLAAAQRIPVLPRGAGSGFSGGALAVQGGIVLVFTRMNRIVERLIPTICWPWLSQT